MTFSEWWASLPQPFGGNRKGYKRGAKDGYEARETEIAELKNALKECFSLIEPVLMGGYDRTLMIEKIKEKYKL